MDPQNLLPTSDEARVRATLLQREGWSLSVKEIALVDGTIINLDGIDSERRIVVEIVGWRGKNTSTLDDKMVADAAKLWIARQHLGENYRAVIACFGSPFATRFQGGLNSAGVRKWAALAIEKLGVDVIEVPLPAWETRERLEREIATMEHELETRVMTPAKENETTARINAKRTELERAKAAYQAPDPPGPHARHIDSEDFDDDDEPGTSRSAGWPSTTGNPSGRGRDNARPRK